MADTTRYYQCKLRLVELPSSHTTAWIEERGAKAGAQIEVMPDRVLWEVVEVYDLGLPESLLKEQQRLNRRSLPSIDPIR